MPSPRIYIETSVWSLAFADDSPDYTADTIAFFDRCRIEDFDLFVSDVVLTEIERAEPPLRDKLIGLISEFRPALLSLDEPGSTLADAFLEAGAVPRSKPDDARHVAIAFCNEMDILLSWNFRHIVNVRRAERFNAIAVLRGYHRPLRIASPAEVMYGDETDSD